MPNIEYLTESQAAKLLSLAPGKGNAWRHLRDQAPHVPLVTLFGLTAVKKSDIQAYLDERRGLDIKRRKLAIIRRAHRQVTLRNGRSVPVVLSRRRCPVCGQFITRRGMGWQWHMASHRLGDKLNVGREIVEELTR
jgi:hypothetical protein